MILAKDNEQKLVVKKRKVLKIENIDGFFHISITHYELDNMSKIAKLLQVCEMTLTVTEMRDFRDSIDKTLNKDENLPF